MDIQAMRYDERLKYRAPIVYCKRNKGFHYTDPNYSIDKLPLTADDIEMFDTMIESFQRFRGAPMLSPVKCIRSSTRISTELELKHFLREHTGITDRLRDICKL